eukprot:g7569.t1
MKIIIFLISQFLMYDVYSTSDIDTYGLQHQHTIPPFNLSCHPSYPSRKGLYGLWPPVVYIENDSKNPVSVRLCESAISDTCTSEQYIKCEHVVPPYSTGILHVPAHLQFFISVYCSLGRYHREESESCFDFPEPLEVYPATLSTNNTFHVPPSPHAFCAGDTDCPREDYFCAPLDNGQGSICQYRACDIKCVCNAILGSYGFGDKSQWIYLYIFAFSCMLVTAAFILWTIRNNRIRAYTKNSSKSELGYNNYGVVLPVYSKVMYSLAIIYLYDAVVWFVPPYLNLSTKDYFIFPVLKLVKATIGETVIEAVFLFLLQRGAGSTELKFSCYGGLLCGFLFGLTNFVQYAKVFGIQLSPILCINYGNIVVSSSCWGTVLVNAYTFAVWLLYAFTLLSPYLKNCGVKWQPPRPAIHRLMFCALVLRTVDVLILFSPCFDVCSTILWSVWFQLELYSCFRADTLYWKDNIKTILETSYMLSPAPKRWSNESNDRINGLRSHQQMKKKHGDRIVYSYGNYDEYDDILFNNGAGENDDWSMMGESLEKKSITSANDKPTRHRRYKSVDDALHNRRHLSNSLPNSTAVLRYELLKSPIIQENGTPSPPPSLPRLNLSNNSPISINCKKGTATTNVVTDTISSSNLNSNFEQQQTKIATPRRRMKLKSMDEILIDFSTLKLKKIVAKGATSSVHMGYMQGKVVAIKVCSCESLTRKTVSDYIREARILASFNHPNVMKLLGCCVVPPSVWIVTEHCERGNLYDVLRSNINKRKTLSNNNKGSSNKGNLTGSFLLAEHGSFADDALDWNLRLYLMLGAAYGLEHIHSNKFIHGDIKPDNFIVTHDWTVKLADFGEAKEKRNKILNPKMSSKKSKEKRIVRGEGAGTMIWLSPERLAPLYSLFVDIDNLSIPIANRSDMSQAADMYSFGLTLWEIAVGKRPFAGMDTYTAGLKVLQNDIRPSLEEIPSTKFTTLLKSCWVRDPNNRLDSKEIVMMLESLNGGWKPSDTV